MGKDINEGLYLEQQFRQAEKYREQFGKWEENSKDYEVKKNKDGTIKKMQDNATGLKYSGKSRQERVSTYSCI